MKQREEGMEKVMESCFFFSLPCGAEVPRDTRGRHDSRWGLMYALVWEMGEVRVSVRQTRKTACVWRGLKVGGFQWVLTVLHSAVSTPLASSASLPNMPCLPLSLSPLLKLHLYLWGDEP